MLNKLNNCTAGFIFFRINILFFNHTHVMNLDKNASSNVSMCKYSVRKFVERQIGACVFGCATSVAHFLIWRENMKKNIEALWMGTPIISSVSKEDQTIISLKVKESREAYSKLEEHIGSETIELLNKYLRIQSEINDLERKNAFVQGFSLGVRLIAEGLED